MKLKVKKFPSPFGVRVLKCPTRCSVIARRRGVSVPFRGSCSEMVDTELQYSQRGQPFPSPFGVRVLKLTHDLRSATISFRFRPLSGFVF